MHLPSEGEQKYFNREIDALRQFSLHSYCLQYLTSLIIGNEGVIITPLMVNRDLDAALK
jgi:hypothetical protein